VPGLADSKLLSAAARERVYGEIVARASSYAVVIIPPRDVDRLGLHVCNLSGMRRALAALAPHPDYVLTDGFGVSGLGAPALAVWKGDRVAACIAAASVVAKVTRDRIMVDMDSRYPGYGFAEHKGYSTEDHMAALAEHGPCPEHRFSYVNVAAAKLASGELGEAAKLASGELGAVVKLGSGPVGLLAVSDEVVTAGRRRQRSTVSVATGDTPILAGVAGDQGREGRTG
jgi:ribonuclease HII